MADVIVLRPPPTVEANLALIGLRLGEAMERCRSGEAGQPCGPCAALDRKHDADLLAVDLGIAHILGREAGRAHIVAYRKQDDGDHDYQTITIRKSTDRGSEDSQLAKLIERRSLATIYVQTYPSGVAWAYPVDLRATVLRKGHETCGKHAATLIGSGGQVFVVVCSWCTALHYVPRAPVQPESYAGLPF